MARGHQKGGILINRRGFLKLLRGSVPALFFPRLISGLSPWKESVLYRHDVRWNVLSLTIDDGFSLYHLETATDLCIKYGFGATFFLNGYGTLAFGESLEFLNKWDEAGFSFAYHSRFHRWEDRNWSRKEWDDDFWKWFDLARKSLGSTIFFRHWEPYARAPFGAFYDPFLEMCEDNVLIPYGWSSDPQDWVRGIMPKKGDVVLLHARPQDWHQFEWLSKNWGGDVVSLPKLRTLSALTDAQLNWVPQSFLNKEERRK